MDFAFQKCKPCEDGRKAYSKEEATKNLEHIKGWSLIEKDGVLWLEKNLSFTDFRSVVTMVNEIGDLAEFEGHHPNLNLHNWNKLQISLSTHAIKGLSENDFIMAAKINRLIDESA
jgi:4a-hydroxytetrahydrobiopterin dehydratase